MSVGTKRHHGWTKAWIVLAALLLTPATALLAWTAYDLYRSQVNYRAYSRLKIGMPAAEVHHLVGRRPDCVVHLAGSEAIFFADSFGIQSCPIAVSDPSALPRAYDSLQVLIGPDGRVAAFTLDGESCVIAAKCKVNGQGLAEMPAGCVE